MPRRDPAGRPQVLRLLALVSLIALSVALAGSAGCASTTDGSQVSPSSSAKGSSMAGPEQDVVIAKSAIMDKPEPWTLGDPKSAIRSYLEWTSYAYRTAESVVATPTMSPEQEVRVDSYVQLNLQKSRIIDQHLDAIRFGDPSVRGRKAVVPASEDWTYRYVSIKSPDKVLEGPYTARYKTTYTLVKKSNGDWVVDTIDVKPIGEVK